MGGLYQWKGAIPYFQRSMSNTVLAGLVHRIFELHIDIPSKRTQGIRKALRIQLFEYVSYVVSATCTSFTEGDQPEADSLQQLSRVYAI